MTAIESPLALLAELTHRCPLQCPYCANPLALEASSREMDTDGWLSVIDQAAALGILQIHFSGGEPTSRKDLPILIKRAYERGLYTNLITSAVMLDEAMLGRLADAGLDHVQISFQDIEAKNADRIGGFAGGHERKLRAAKLVKESGLALTLNFVVHRQNLERLPEMIQLGLDFEAGRIEVAHVQYYGWALANRAALLPSREQLERATEVVEEARARLKGQLVIDYVVPDYYALRPKACMGGWARRFINITPSGTALPCHAAETLPGFEFPSVRTMPLAEIWRSSAAFERFRGTSWMAAPCQSCERREIDWGGCRCQAFAMTGDASRTDPACQLSPDHHLLQAATEQSSDPPPAFQYRRIGAAEAIE